MHHSRPGAAIAAGARGPRYESAARTMMSSLLEELLQEEEGLAARASRDAARFDGFELGGPLTALASHCAGAIPLLHDIGASRGLRRRRAIRLLLRLVARARDACRDRAVPAERAFRSMLARLRRGIDLVCLVRSAAEVAEDVELVAFCETWLAVRIAVLGEMLEQIDWFADRPRVSMETGHAIGGARGRMRACRLHASSEARLQHTFTASLVRGLTNASATAALAAALKMHHAGT